MQVSFVSRAFAIRVFIVVKNISILSAATVETPRIPSELRAHFPQLYSPF
jgi:hypothetical protein